jgi:hypothetical protein
MSSQVEFHCPQCSFRVFNRLYPLCEACGARLPDAILYSEEERRSLQAAQAQRDEEEHQNQLRRDRHKRGHSSGGDGLVGSVEGLVDGGESGGD